MKRMSSWVFAAATAAGIIASMPFTAGSADDEGSATYGVKIPLGYRECEMRWPALSAQRFAVDKWSLCRVVV